MKKNSLGKLWILSLLSGLLLSIPYIYPHCGLIALVAFLPLLAAEKLATESGKRHFGLCYYSAFLLWNVIATWWIWYATPAGAVAAIILNALQMAVVFRLFRFLTQRYAGFFPYLALAVLWCAWEHLYQDWQVTWPWLNLGNSFAQSIKHIQWYEVTGSIAGSLWILLANGLIFRTLLNISERRKSGWWALGATVLIAVPILLSHIRYAEYGKKIASYDPAQAKEVVVLQPNIDPYQDKFGGKTQRQQDEILLNLAKENITDSTFLVVAPETFFNPSSAAGSIVENNPVGNSTLDSIRLFSAQNNVNFIFGAVTQTYYFEEAKPTRSARPMGARGWYDLFNTAVYTGKDSALTFYHKSKLVVMAETVPYIGNTSVLGSLGLDLGGGFGNFGTQSYRGLFITPDDVKIGSAVCYESVFANFFRDYVKDEGANLMTIITNDGWWKNTSGHIQHLHYASLRAIETRRDIARSANTGTSALINQRGDILQPTPWWEKCAIRGEVYPSAEITPFVKYGDITGLLSCWISAAFVLIGIISRRRRFS
ncbi:MAG: apolipoprotein N-acyltransferase [Bacteroidales bacterium]|nr:apolipoprotein N-acyltransferase [Bacteroidales bacterium]